MRNTTLLFVLLVLLSGPAQAHHGGPHQNIILMPEASRVDCDKVASFIRRWDILQKMLRNHGKDLTEDEDKDLHNAKELFSIYCFEA